MSKCDPKSKPRQTKTPAALRHLLTERAAAAGALQQAQLATSPLRRQLEILRAETLRLQDQLAPVAEEEQRLVAELRALDQVIHHMFPGVRAAALKPVQAWAGRYGPRGALKAFLQATLQAAPPGGLSTSSLCDLAADKFGLDISTSDKRQRFRRVVKPQLLKWETEGLVTATRDSGSQSAKWGWQSGPSGASLLALALASDDQESNPLGTEMGGQRAGGRHG